ncbi:unnamed protein product [Heligmosomoides polygyrus]|uniref:Uncharacterized protein n=1 Tax=Heligmosomoides polygyrus TaxID=6339 RepID=A0A183G7Q3_HELPZ|nr:unnamed protein product [Heligmosomoides polygyrus]
MVAAASPLPIPPSPVLAPDSPSRRIEARLRQRMINERLRAVYVPVSAEDGKTSIQELMNRYLNKSGESVPKTINPPAPTERPDDGESDEIRRLVDRYCSPTAAAREHDSPLVPDTDAIERPQNTTK